MPSAVDALIEALPKVELHVHLEGSIPPGLLVELAGKHRVSGLPDTVAGVGEWMRFADFAHFVTVYEASVQTLRDEADFALLVEQVAAGLAAQNVRYAEVIVSPDIHLTRGVDPDALFGGLERGRLAARREHGIQLRWIADFPGHWGLSRGEATLEAVLAADLDSMIGFSVGGIEVERAQFAPVFDRARAAGLHSVPHAGETHGPDRMWAAIHRLGAERIGHGIRCLDDPDLVAYLRATRLPLDVCPTSNYCTGVVERGRPHPLAELLAAGLLVTLNSDDPPMFNTTLTQEYRFAHQMGLAPGQLVELARNGVRASFLDDPAKAELTEIDTVAGEHRRG